MVTISDRNGWGPRQRSTGVILQRVKWASVPDPRRPFIKDFHLACGHVLVHRPLPRGADGRMHLPTRLRCPWCARVGGGALAAPPAGPVARPLPAPTPAAAPNSEAVDEPAWHRWSPRDLASRNWE